MGIKTMGEEIEQEKILEKIASLRQNPNEMITYKMGGKMEGFNSLSSSAYCGNCPVRIDNAMAHIRSYGKEASDLLDRYCLPSDDKRHITSKRLINGLLKIDEDMEICVCVFCYAQRAQEWQDGSRIKFKANHEILSGMDGENSLPYLPDIPKHDNNGNNWFRFNAEGDCNSVAQAIKELAIARDNPDVEFRSWTKNFGYYEKAYKIIGGCPDNFKLIISSEYINKPNYKLYNYAKKVCPDMVYKLFTVCTKDWAEANGKAFNCCGGGKEKKCKDCKLCYTNNNVDYIWEILR